MAIRIKHQPRGKRMAYFCPVCSRQEFSTHDIMCHINRYHKGYWIANKGRLKV